MFKFSYKTILKYNTIIFCKFQLILFGSLKSCFFHVICKKLLLLYIFYNSISMLYDVFYLNQIHVLSSYDVKGEKARRACISCLPRCCSVAKSCPTLWPHELQHVRLPCPSLFPGVCSDSCLLSQWCYLTISSSANPFSSCPQPFPASGSFLMSQVGKVSELQFQHQSSQWIFRVDFLRTDWFHLLAAQGILKSLLQYHNSKCQLFGTQLSLSSITHISAWLLEKL